MNSREIQGSFYQPNSNNISPNRATMKIETSKKRDLIPDRSVPFQI